MLWGCHSIFGSEQFELECDSEESAKSVRKSQSNESKFSLRGATKLLCFT